jgi:hypothetical protein
MLLAIPRGDVEFERPKATPRDVDFNVAVDTDVLSALANGSAMPTSKPG